MWWLSLSRSNADRRAGRGMLRAATPWNTFSVELLWLLSLGGASRSSYLHEAIICMYMGVLVCMLYVMCTHVHFWNTFFFNFWAIFLITFFGYFFFFVIFATLPDASLCSRTSLLFYCTFDIWNHFWYLSRHVALVAGVPNVFCLSAGTDVFDPPFVIECCKCTAKKNLDTILIWVEHVYCLMLLNNFFFFF